MENITLDMLRRMKKDLKGVMVNSATLRLFSFEDIEKLASFLGLIEEQIAIEEMLGIEQ